MKQYAAGGLTLTLALCAQPARRDARPEPYTVSGCAVAA